MFRHYEKYAEKRWWNFSINLKNESSAVKNYYQINVEFDTVDSMGANFINSCLEKILKPLKMNLKLILDFLK